MTKERAYSNVEWKEGEEEEEEGRRLLLGVAA